MEPLAFSGQSVNAYAEGPPRQVPGFFTPDDDDAARGTDASEWPRAGPWRR